jgi:hypothetical protein
MARLSVADLVDDDALRALATPLQIARNDGVELVEFTRLKVIAK